MLVFRYDAADKLTLASNHKGADAYKFTNNALGQVTKSQQPAQVVLDFTYDAAGNRVDVVDNRGGATASVYDGVNRLLTRTQKTAGGQARVVLKYRADDHVTDLTRQVKTAVANASWLTSSFGHYEYDAAGRLYNYWDAVPTVPSSANFHKVTDTRYGYNEDAQLSREWTQQWPQGGGGATQTYDRFGYDSRGQLAWVNALSFAFDANGNPAGAGVIAGNRLETLGGTTYHYDPQGNRTSTTTGAAGSDVTKYQYDEANRLTSYEAVSTTSEGGTRLQVAYRYDVFGNRLSEMRRGSTHDEGGNEFGRVTTLETHFAYDGSGMTAEWQGAVAGPVRHYLHGDGVDQVFGHQVGTAVSWYLTDRRGSVRGLVTGAGVLVERQDYSAFGVPDPVAAPTLATNTVLTQSRTRFGYTSREYDSATHLQYNRARYYDPTLRRFISEDPLGLAAGDTNLYRYAGNNPINATDPSGLDTGFEMHLDRKDAGQAVRGNQPGEWRPLDDLAAAIGRVASDRDNQNRAREVGADLFYLTPFGMAYGVAQAAGLQLDTWAVDRKVAADAATYQREAPPASPNVIWGLAKAGGEGLGDGSAIVANTFTFGLITPLNDHVDRLVAENPTYVVAQVSSVVAREALIMAATLSTGNVLRGAAAGAEVGCWTLRGAKLVQTVNAGVDLYRVGSSGYGAFKAYQEGDVAGVFTNGLGVALGGLGFASSASSLAKAYGATGGSKGFARWLFEKSCFGAGTLLVTLEGCKPIEEFREGDRLLSRSECDPDGPVEEKVVEEVFVRTARVWHLRVGGRVIKTTAEHPFWVRLKGWVSASMVQPGDELNSHDGQWVAVEEVYDTGEYETVYNLRVADYHTYFVGGEDWGFSVWAHNKCTDIVSENGQTILKIENKFAAGSAESRQLQRFIRAWNEEVASAGGSMTRRILTAEEQAASAAWTAAMREQFPARFAGKVVGHVPDAAAGSLAVPDRAMALLPSVNSYLGGLLSGVPVDTTYNVVRLFR